MQNKKYVWFYIGLFIIFSFAYFHFSSKTFPFIWIGNCNPAGYDEEHYISHCVTNYYGDSEHWVIWSGADPEIQKNLKQAQVLFLGNSRAQYGFSTNAMKKYFDKIRVKHYSLGFGLDEADKFATQLLKKLALHPQLIVVNSDPFFTGFISGEGNYVIEGGWGVKFAYGIKIFQQNMHSKKCLGDDRGWLDDTFLCRQPVVKTVFRSRLNGHWLLDFHDISPGKKHPVSFDGKVWLHHIDRAKKYAENFISITGIARECLVLTVTPMTHSEYQYGRELAASLGTPGIFIKPPGLFTFDTSHLDAESAEKWSHLMLEQLTPHIENCITEKG